MAGFAVIALITTILAFVFIRNLVSTWTLGTLPGEPNLTGSDLPTPAPGEKFPREWSIFTTILRSNSPAMGWLQPRYRPGHGSGL